MKYFSCIALFILINFTSETIICQEQTYGEHLLDSLENLGEYAGNDEVARILTKALPKIKASNDIKSYTQALLGLSFCYYYLDDYVLWGKYLNEGLKYAKDSINNDNSSYATALNNLAVYEKSIGNYKKANQIYLSAVEIEQKSNSDPYEIAVIYDNISLNYISLGDHKNAVEYSKKALELKKQSNAKHFQKDPDSRYYQYSISLYNTGKAYQNLNELEEAKLYFQKSINQLKLFQPEKKERKNKRLIKIYHKLAEVDAALENPKSLLKNIRLAQPLQEKVKSYEFKTYQLLGVYYTITKQYSLAEKNFITSFEKAKENYADNKESPVPAIVLGMLGDSYFSQHKYVKSIETYQQALQFIDPLCSGDLIEDPDLDRVEASSMALELLSKKALTAKTIYKLNADTTSKRDYLSISYNTYNLIVDLASLMRNTFIADQSKFHIADDAYPIINQGLEVVFDKFHLENNDSINNQVLNYLEFNKSGILFERIRDKFGIASSSVPETIINDEIETSTNLSYFSKLLDKEETLDEKNVERIKNLKNKIFELNEQKASIQKALEENYPDYYSLKNTHSNKVNIKNVQSNLSPDQLLIEYYVADSAIYSIAISDDDFKFHRTPIDDVAPLVNQFYEEISSHPTQSQNALDFKKLGYDIYKKLLSHFIEEQPDINEIIIIPDNLLAKIPFEGLYNKHNEQYNPLLLEYTISYLYSIQQISEFSNSYNYKNKILCLAPKFDDANGQQRSCLDNKLGNLPYAQEELKFLSKNFKGLYLSGNKAKAEALKENISTHNIIHLATHGCLNPTNPMLSEIYLADKTLTNYDIENFNVRPDLVVLSACNTGSGVIENAEGVISLSRGFFEAGVKSLQSSLWSIDDHSSALIMKEMYRNLKQGQSKSGSLQNAKIHHLKHADKLRLHPYFWAGIIQVGDPSPLFKSRKMPTINKYVTGLFVLIGLVFIGRILFKQSSRG